MRALTLWQPWATAVALHGKIVENRTWLPPESLLGERIAIHAGAARKDAWALPPGVTVPEPLPRSGVVATAIVVGALDLREGRRDVRVRGTGSLAFLTGGDDSSDDWDRIAKLDSNPWWLGPVGWLLEEIRPLSQPVSCKGAMGLWTLGIETERTVIAAGG